MTFTFFVAGIAVMFKSHTHEQTRKFYLPFKDSHVKPHPGLPVAFRFKANNSTKTQKAYGTIHSMTEGGKLLIHDKEHGAAIIVDPLDVLYVRSGATMLMQHAAGTFSRVAASRLAHFHQHAALATWKVNTLGEVANHRF